MTKNVPVAAEDRGRFAHRATTRSSLLARWACVIEDHYSAKRGRPVPMDIEWAKDGHTGELFIVQARPETVQSQKKVDSIEVYKLRRRAACWSPGEASARRSAAARCGSSSACRTSPVPARRSAGHRQDRPRLGADHEEGRRHRHQPRRPDLPRRHRQPRAGLPAIVGTEHGTELLTTART